MSEADAVVPTLDPAVRDAVRTAVLAAAATPMKLADLKKVAKGAATAKKDKKPAETVVDALVAAGELHKQAPAKTAPYARDKPPEKNDAEKVRIALLQAAATPQTLAKLITAATAATKADKTFVASEADKLITSEQLHKQSPAQKAPYGREKPKQPHPLEVGPGKTAFGKLVAAVRKLLDSVQGVPAAELLDRLRTELAKEPVQPKPTEPTPPMTLPPPATTVVSPPPSVGLTPERIRAGLKAAYDDLCLHPEFEDKLVEIRRLYPEAVRNLPGLTVEQFHRELEHLQSERLTELQPINEVQRAKDPELAIRHGDRLLYFVRWR